MSNHPADAQIHNHFMALAAPLAERVGWAGVETIAAAALRIAGDHLPAYVGLMQLSTGLLDRLLVHSDRGTALEIYRLAGRLGEDHPGPAVQLLEASPDLIGRLLQDHGRQAAAALLDLVAGMAADAPLLAGRFFQSSPELLARLDPDALAHMARCLAAAAAENPDTAIRLLEMAPGVIDRVPRGGEGSPVDELHALVAATVSANARLAEQLYRQSPCFIGAVGLAGLRAVARLSLDLGREGWPAAFALLAAGCDLIERLGLEGLEKTARLGRTIAAACPQTAAAFFQKSAPILDRVDAEGLWAFARFCADMARTGPGMAVRFPEQGPGLMDRLLERGDRRLIGKVYGLARRTGRANPMIAHKILEKSPELMDRIGMEGLEAFSQVVQHLARSSWTTADALIKVGLDIVDRMGLAGVREMAAFGLKVAGKNVYGAVSLLEKGPAILDRLLPMGGRALATEVYGLASAAADTDWAVAVRLLQNSPDIVNQADVRALAQIAGRSLQMAAEDAPQAMALLDISARVIEKTDLATLLLVADFWMAAGRASGSGSAGRIASCPARIEALIAQGGPEMPSRVYGLVLGVARQYPKAAVQLLNHSQAHLAAAGFEGLALIAGQTVALSAFDPDQAARFAAGEGIAFADFMSSIPKGLRLETIKPVLFNYLAALLGYQLEIEAGPRPAIHARKIVLPDKVREFENDEDNFVYYKVMATRLEAHLEYGGFDLDGTQAERLFAGVRQRYGAAAPGRENALDDFYRLFPEPPLAEDLVRIFEAYRIEQRLKREYPGLGIQIIMVNRHDLKKRPPPNRIRNGKQRAVEGIARALMAGAWDPRASRTDTPIHALAREWAVRLESGAAAFGHTLEAAAAVYDRIDAAFKEGYRPVQPPSQSVDPGQINRHIGGFAKTSRDLLDRMHRQEGQQRARAGGAETRGEASREGAAHAREAPRQARVPHAVASAAGERRRLESDTETDDQRGAHVSAEQRGATGSSDGMKFSVTHIEQLLRRLFKEKGITPREVERQTERMRPDQIGNFLCAIAATAAEAGPLEAEKGTRRYREWDDGQNGYRDNWARIREQTVPAGGRAFYREALGRHAGLLKRVRREFQRMRPEELARLNRQPDGDEIDLDAAIENIIDRKIGLAPTENNYQHTQKKRRDIAVAILVDMSKSTQGDTLRFEKEALVILSEALHAVGDAYAIFGFSGDNRDNVDFYRIKDFEEPNSRRVQERISAIECGLENRDGAALRHTTDIIRGREEKTRLIVLLSDGKPVDKAYAGRYAIEDTRRALLEAQQAGVKTFCITVDHAAPDYLPRMYRHSSWVVVDDLTRLPEKISRIFARLTN